MGLWHVEPIEWFKFDCMNKFSAFLAVNLSITHRLEFRYMRTAQDSRHVKEPEKIEYAESQCCLSLGGWRVS